MASSVAVGTASAATIFFEDFESDPAADPAVMANWVHNGNGSGSNASRLFDTGNYGGTRLWIASSANAAAGTGIDSTATIELDPSTTYEFSAALVTETFSGNRTATGTYDLLIEGASLIGGPQSFVARGDDADGATPNDSNSYEDQLTTQYFDSGVGGNLTISIAFSGTDSSSAFVGIDNVSISTIPEPSALLLLGAALTGVVVVVRRRV
ncbi:PEP-CTERM sorting domain-containing protein [Aeoliella mucimassa]|nr:PEP-CTERM sorting domain-containing protein [Aeoliella mucimassa]